MSWDSKRQEIAQALSTVAGVKGYKFRPKVLMPGDAYPQLASINRVEGWFVASWNVFVLLPQDESSASVWIDENAESLWEALETSVGYVTDIEPVEIAVGNTFQYGLQISLRSE